MVGEIYMDRDSKGKFIKGHKNFSISKKKKILKCEYCNINFEEYPSNRIQPHIFCSRKCCFKFKKTKFKYEIEPELLKSLYWGNQYSAKKISSLFSVSVSIIYCRMKSYKIPLRNHIDAGKLLDNYHLYDRIPWNKGKTYEDDNRIPAGSKSSFWKGGVSTKNEKLRKSNRFKDWRKKVFERDNYTCQYCHDRSKKGYRIIIHPHHIKSWANFPEDRFKVENGITLCINCHRYVTNINILDQQ